MRDPGRRSAPLAFAALAVFALAVFALAVFALDTRALVPVQQILYHGFNLERAEKVRLHPDDTLLAVQGRRKLTLFARDPMTGTLTQTAAYDDDQVGFAIAFAPALAWSVDGAHLYSAFDGGLLVYALDPSEARLAAHQTFTDGAGGVVGLDSLREIVPSPDGEHVYAVNFANAGPTGDSRGIAIFDRDTATGDLTYIGTLIDDDATVDGLTRAQAMAISPDGEDLYVLADGIGDNGISRFARDAATGLLTFGERIGAGSVPAIANPQDLAISAGGAHLYVTGAGQDALVVFARNGVTGVLTFLEAEENGMGGVVSFDSPAGLAVWPDGEVITVAARSSDALVTFTRDPATGLVTFLEAADDAALGVGTVGRQPRGVAFSADGAMLHAPGYFASEVVGRLAVFTSDPLTGSLGFVEVRDDRGVDAPDLISPRGLAFSPGGEHLYVLAGDALSAFHRDPVTSILTHFQRIDGDDGTLGLSGQSALAVAPDGVHVYAEGENDGFGGIFARDAVTGTLTFAGTFVQFDSNEALDMRFASSEHLYTVTDSNAIVFYRRDPTTGALTLEQALEDGVGPVDGLSIPVALEISPNGEQIYVAGEQDDAIAVFGRDTTTGFLTFLDVEIDGVDGVTGIREIQDLALSADGAFLYAVAEASNALTVFARDSDNNGLLTFVESLVNGVDVSEGLAGAAGVEVVGDGRYVLVSSPGDRSLTVFVRDETAGTVRLGGLDQGTFDQENDNFMRQAVSPDGRYLVVRHNDTNAISVHGLPIFFDGFESGDTGAWSTTVP